MTESEPPHPRDIAGLCRLEKEGRRLKYLFFWGHQPSRTRNIGPSCLSQWWPAAFTLDGITYAGAEHFMMAAKARLFGDGPTAAAVLAAPHPGEAKALGRRVAGFDERTWAAHRYGIVVRANRAKFEQNPDLWDYLLATTGRVLVEASPLDRVWGIGLGADDERAGSPSQWRGLNLLGFALMDVRAELHATGRSAAGG